MTSCIAFFKLSFLAIRNFFSEFRRSYSSRWRSGFLSTYTAECRFSFRGSCATQAAEAAVPEVTRTDGVRLNAAGYLRDDNSLVKSPPRSLSVRGPSTSHLHRARMGNEFVASHIWQILDHVDLASRVPLLNSFVPNLVWLPAQIAKLTDREGGIVQRTLQAMSRSIYESAPVQYSVQDVVREAWALLPPSAVETPSLELANLNWFESTPNFLARRVARLNEVVAALETLESGGVLTKKIVTSRYTTGLPTVAAEKRQMLLASLRRIRGDTPANDPER
jgi:hypothetical protein